MRPSRPLLAAACLAALCAPAFAGDGSSTGYVDASIGQSKTSLRGLQDADENIVEVSGAWSIALSETIGLQADGGLAYLDEAGETQPFATLHVAWRNSDIGLAGGFLGAARDGDDTVYGGGLEGQYYINRFTLYGSLGYARGQGVPPPSAPPPSVSKTDIDYWAARGQVRYFPQDNLRIAGTVGYGSSDNGFRSRSGYALGADAEYLLSSLPLSVYGRVGYNDYGAGIAGEVENATTGTLGVRWNFGAESLFYRDRAGATSDGFRDLLLLRSGNN